MAYTLFDMMRDAFMKLGQLNISTATGGSTTTVVDTKQDGLHDDDAWKDGLMFVIRDAGGAAAAPQGEFSRISAYSDATTTFTVGTLTAAVAAGDTVGWTNSYFPYLNMIELANAALQSLGDLLLVDTTSITTASSQTEYTLPVALKRVRPLRVDIQGITTDANKNDWTEVQGWEYVPATAGSTGLLVLSHQPPSGYKLRVWYRGPHPTLSTAASVVHEAVDPDLAALMLVEKALEWQNSRGSGSDDFLIQRWNDAKQQVEMRLKMFPPLRAAKPHKHFARETFKTHDEFKTP